MSGQTSLRDKGRFGLGLQARPDQRPDDWLTSTVPTANTVGTPDMFETMPDCLLALQQTDRLFRVNVSGNYGKLNTRVNSRTTVMLRGKRSTVTVDPIRWY